MRFSLSFLLTAVPFILAAPVIEPRSGSIIPGKYIVKLKDDAANDLLEAALQLLQNEPEHKFSISGFKGFSGEISDAVVKALSKLDQVEYIEKDAVVQHYAPMPPEKRAYVTQSSAAWGLGRLSHVDKGSTSYTYDDSAGTNTCAYVVDTGIYTAHPEFEGRATFLANYAGDGSNTDGNGHGTHVAGTIGSKSYGIAKNTKLYAVKVLDSSGSGSNSGVIAGINFVTSDSKTRSCPNGAVANMSLGGSKSTALNSAVASAVAAGVFFAVAAGNSKTNAGNTSPASEPTAFTVAASDSNDAIASFSNYGAVVDAFAPGVNILSTWKNGNTNTISGTSMASPHAAGLGAYLLALEGKKTPAALSDRIKELSNKDKISGVPSGTVNYLIFNGNPSA